MQSHLGIQDPACQQGKTRVAHAFPTEDATHIPAKGLQQRVDKQHSHSNDYLKYAVLFLVNSITWHVMPLVLSSMVHLSVLLGRWVRGLTSKKKERAKERALCSVIESQASAVRGRVSPPSPKMMLAKSPTRKGTSCLQSSSRSEDEIPLAGRLQINNSEPIKPLVLHSALVGLRTLVQVEQRTSWTRLLQLSNLSTDNHGTLLVLKPQLTPSANSTA